ncbi:MmgE/PrpD family protein [Alicycliphilus denitrificans]|uniref:MmgE/PrpD family protein n=1 Tax=Alicycliphilus denitrificans (strain DSM 14773 / CIP 107495 / K601) TaxID=596154 RepID=F4GFJ7_ALIDK|nr:MmgE/PrpD family protein [Alicycliphilus denitrificans]ADV00642.1 MmgE/PrpD family protein [Alicycliphilus denitrificans BC]AEB83929.1 MmgE/PrpD family protein [Alicycliphilus denitrificans K601]GAO24138.1 MmgE/PrpD family protein [Alicycliphilus sp. B1]
MTDSALPHCPPLEQALVRFVQDLRYEDLDAPAHAGVNRLMRDQLALQIGISQMPWSQQLLKYAAAQQRPGASRVAASGLTMSAQDAAFVNGSYGHGFEYDDAHGPSYSHPGSCVIPAALALGEELGATLEEVVTALVAGYEVYTRIGLLAAPDLLQRGFHPHCVLSSFGAAAVAAKLRRLDAETTLHALAIALSHTSGTTEYTSTGGSIKRIHAGIGTKSGMAAAEMARAGITGPRAFLSGNKGFFKTFLQRGPGDGAEARFAPGQPFQIATVWLKAYCACYCTHAYIDALRPFAARRTEIADVHLKITPHFNVVVGTANANAYTPRNIEHVQFSLPIQAAFALLGLGNGYPVHRDYLAGKVDMAPVIALARGIRITEEPALEKSHPGKFVADVTVAFQDGSSQHVFVADPIGTDTNPMPEQVQDAKFMELTEGVLGAGRARALLAALRAMDPAMKAADLTALCAAAQ